MASNAKKRVRVSTPSNPTIEDDSSGDEPYTQPLEPDNDSAINDPLSFDLSQPPRVSFFSCFNTVLISRALFVGYHSKIDNHNVLRCLKSIVFR